MVNLRHVLANLILLPLIVTLPALSLAEDPQPRGKASFDTAAIDGELGTPGAHKGEVYKIALPRTDLKVTVEDVTVKPGLALGSWMAFKATAKGAVAHGDLVLTQKEVFPVVRELETQGFRITALHNHLINETPRIMYLHFWGEGDPAHLARGLKQALAQTNTPLGKLAEKSAREENPFEAERIQVTIGEKGTVKDGVLKISVPRPEAISRQGVELPASMGMATALNFQSAGQGQVAATGDFVMRAEEVNHVARALADHGIMVTALHNHLLHEAPDLFFMHFWAKGTSDKVAAGLRAGLEAMKQH